MERSIGPSHLGEAISTVTDKARARLLLWCRSSLSKTEERRLCRRPQTFCLIQQELKRLLFLRADMSILAEGTRRPVQIRQRFSALILGLWSRASTTFVAVRISKCMDLAHLLCHATRRMSNLSHMALPCAVTRDANAKRQECVHYN